MAGALESPPPSGWTRSSIPPLGPQPTSGPPVLTGSLCSCDPPCLSHHVTHLERGLQSLLTEGSGPGHLPPPCWPPGPPLGHTVLREQVHGPGPELGASHAGPLLSEFLVTSVGSWWWTRSPESVPLVWLRPGSIQDGLDRDSRKHPPGQSAALCAGGTLDPNRNVLPAAWRCHVRAARLGGRRKVAPSLRPSPATPSACSS